MNAYPNEYEYNQKKQIAPRYDFGCLHYKQDTAVVWVA